MSLHNPKYNLKGKMKSYSTEYFKINIPLFSKRDNYLRELNDFSSNSNSRNKIQNSSFSKRLKKYSNNNIFNKREIEYNKNRIQKKKLFFFF